MSVGATLVRHGPAAAGYGALAVLFTMPVWTDPTHLLPGAPTSDMADHAWGYHWFARSLAGGAIPFHTDLVNHPTGGSLFFGDPVGALLSVPLVWIFGLAAGFSLGQALQLVLAGLAGYAAALHWSGSRAAAFVGGTVFAFSSYALSCLYSGTTGYLVTAPLPLYLIAAHRALVDGGRRWTVLAAAAAGLATLAAPYYGLFTALVTLILAGVLAVRGRVETDALLRRCAALAALAAVAVVPVLVGVRAGLLADDALVSPASSPGWDQALLPRVDLLTFVAPWDHHYPDMAAAGNEGILHANGLGWIALGLAAFAGLRVRRARTWWATLGLWGVLMAGPQLTVAGHPVSLGSLPVYLPYAALCFPGSPLRAIHHPHRMVIWGMLLLGLLAALGFARLMRGWSGPARGGLAALVAAAIAVEVLLLSPAVWPLPVTRLDPPARCAELGREAAGAILDWPPGAVRESRTYLLRATVHRRPVAYWVTSFLPDELGDNGLVQQMLARLHDPTLRRTTREGRVLAWPVAPGRPAAPASLDQLVQLGFSHVLVHPDTLGDDEVIALRDLLAGAGLEARRWEDGTLEFALPSAGESP